MRAGLHGGRMGVWALGFAAVALGSGCAREPVALRIAKGQQALREGRYREAAESLRSAARDKPDSAVLHYNWGMAELESGRFPKAAEAFTRAAALTTDGATDALEGLARTRQLQKRWDDAGAVYEQAVAKAGRLPRLLAGMAAVELNLGRGEQALILLAEALGQNLDEPTALYNMACLQRDAFRDQPAAAAYLGRFLAVVSDNPAARAKGEQALQALGGTRGATSARAESLIMRSRQATTAAEAAALAEQAVAEDPLSADALWNLAFLLGQQDADRDRIARAYARFVRRFPNDARKARIPPSFQPVSFERAIASARAATAAARWPAAVTAYQQALAADDRSPEVWLELCVAAQGASDLPTALEAASKALSLRPGDPDALYHAGTVHYRLGHRDAAVEHIRRYLLVAPEGAHKQAVAKWLNELGG